MAAYETRRIHHGMPHIITLVNEPISHLAQFSALILTIIVVIVFAVRLWVFEKWLMPKVYEDKYLRLSEANRRSFVNHHVAGGCKLLLLIAASYPFLSIAFGKGTPHTPYALGSKVTLGDMMIVCSNLFSVMYIFELYYRMNISLISAAHHIGAIVIAQAAIAISLNFGHEVDAVYEFVLCFVWGAFDVVAELWPHIAMIIYRIIPDRHTTLEKIFLATSILEVAGTILETIIVFWLWGTLWHRWTLPFRVVTPLLHTLFSAAQLWGAYIFNQLRQRERKKVMESLKVIIDVEQCEIIYMSTEPVQESGN